MMKELVAGKHTSNVPADSGQAQTAEVPEEQGKNHAPKSLDDVLLDYISKRKDCGENL
jgi:hypothetical protein